MTEPTQCQNCFKDYDFKKECFGDCSTCKKDYMCEKCCYEHDCIPGKCKRLQMTTNPSWLCNLLKNL